MKKNKRIGIIIGLALSVSLMTSSVYAQSSNNVLKNSRSSLSEAFDKLYEEILKDPSKFEGMWPAGVTRPLPMVPNK